MKRVLQPAAPARLTLAGAAGYVILYEVERKNDHAELAVLS
jgi:hypothetical protein